jgi:hypothetical protein
MNEDQQINMAHLLEQSETAIVNFAKMIGSFHKQLLAEKFTPEQAFELVRDYQQESLRTMFNPHQ